jgi:uncharacterized protein YgiM (DUF1202 family)
VLHDNPVRRTSAFLVVVCVCAVLSECSDATIVVVKSRLQRAPAKESEVLATIAKGSTVKIAQCSNGWCRASWNGRDGYILTKNLRIGAGARSDIDEPDNDGSADRDDLAMPDRSDAAGPND